MDMMCIDIGQIKQAAKLSKITLQGTRTLKSVKLRRQLRSNPALSIPGKLYFWLTKPTPMNKLTYIDDSPLDQFILKRMLSRHGSSCQVKCTDSCLGLLSLLSQPRLQADQMPDIILLDIYMPGVNPWDFLDRVRWLYPTLPKPVKIYILSARKCPADVERAKSYPFVKAFMLKPITKEILERLMMQIKFPANRFAMLEEA